MNKDMTSTNKVVFLETHVAGIDPDVYILQMINLNHLQLKIIHCSLMVKWVAVDHKFAPWMEKYNIQEIQRSNLRKRWIAKTL